MAVASAPVHGDTESRKAALRCVDTDVHQDLPSFQELRPFLARKWHDWLDDGGPIFAARGVTHVGSGRMDDAVNEEDNLCAGDPEWVVQQLIVKYRVDVGVLTGSGQMFGPNLQRNARFMTAMCSAYNDWTLEKWVRPYPYFKGSIVVNVANPEAAAAEIHRLGDDPGMVQVMLFSHGREAHGHDHYWPIYRAAVEHGLPIGVHIANDIGNSNPQTPVGWYTSFVEHHTDHTQTAMANFVSLVTEGVFEEFSTLKYLTIEGGVCWAPYVMGRLDRIYPALKRELPYLKKLPSEYILEHCYFSTQPIEEPRDPKHLLAMLELIDAKRTLLFATDYPHWDFDNPMTALHSFPQELRRRVLVDNALDFYGDRLVVPSR
jgi:predicted TIM-barrel fold metal-dependent hydrolase